MSSNVNRRQILKQVIAGSAALAARGAAGAGIPDVLRRDHRAGGVDGLDPALDGDRSAPALWRMAPCDDRTFAARRPCR